MEHVHTNLLGTWENLKYWKTSQKRLASRGSLQSLSCVEKTIEMHCDFWRLEISISRAIVGASFSLNATTLYPYGMALLGTYTRDKCFSDVINGVSVFPVISWVY